MRVNAGAISGDNLFDNELYRIGGRTSLRGFNEQAFSASLFSVFSAEYRFLFDQNSAFFGFVDYGYYESEITVKFTKDTPLGFGLGVNFNTNSGIFSLIYGLGRQQGNPILVKNGKIHFGYINLF